MLARSSMTSATRGLAVLGEDEGAAADLEIIAGRAQDRGALAAALGALELAASLTPHGPDRARRLLAAAELAFQLGDPPAVSGRAETIALISPTKLSRPSTVPRVPPCHLMSDVR
jgi:hypothetical protein